MPESLRNRQATPPPAHAPADASSNPTPRSGIQFVLGCGQRNRSNGSTTSETIMHRVRRPEFEKLFGLSAVRRSVPFSRCRPRHPRGNRSQSLLYEGVSVGAERIYTKTSLAPLVLVDFLPWIDLSRGPALVIANPASDLLGDLYVITPKTSRKAAKSPEIKKESPRFPY